MAGLASCDTCKILIHSRFLYDCSHCSATYCLKHLKEHHVTLNFELLHVPQFLKGNA